MFSWNSERNFVRGKVLLSSGVAARTLWAAAVERWVVFGVLMFYRELLVGSKQLSSAVSMPQIELSLAKSNGSVSAPTQTCRHETSDVALAAVSSSLSGRCISVSVGKMGSSRSISERFSAHHVMVVSELLFSCNLKCRERRSD